MTQNRPTRPNFQIICGDVSLRKSENEDTNGQSIFKSGANLSGELALLYFLGLVADQPIEKLSDPHFRIRFGNCLKTDLNEVLCELRNLPWFDSRTFQLSVTKSDTPRRNLNWNKDGQLTLRTVYNGGVIQNLSGAERLSVYWPVLKLSELTYGGENKEASPRPPRDVCLRDLAAYMCQYTSSDFMLEAATGILETPCLELGLNEVLSHAIGLPPAAGAAANKRTLDSIFTEAEKRVQGRLRRRDMGRSKAERPSVVAAQLAIHLSHETNETGTYDFAFRDAATQLTQHAPRLLNWVNARHARGIYQDADRMQNACLPIGMPSELVFQPSDSRAHVAVSAAMVTILKALMGQIHIMTAGQRRPLADELNLFQSQVGLARMASAGSFPADVYDDTRLGQQLGLQVLREVLEEANSQTHLVFQDFDDVQCDVIANPRRFGRGFVQLRLNGSEASWPEDQNRPGGHLTEVV